MWNFERGPLFAPAGDETGAAPLDPGAPFVHGNDAPVVTKPAEKAKEESAESKRITALEKELKETRDSEKYWADRARAGNAPRHEEPESDDEPEPEEPSRVARRQEKPEELLDDVSKEGLEALKKRGLITKEELDAAIAKAGRDAEARIANAQANANIDARIERDYADLKNPDSDLFKRAGQHFRDMVADDPSLKRSPATLVAAAKLAKKELEAEKKVADDKKRNEDRGPSRRERIDSQSSDRAPSGRSEADDDPVRELSPLQSQIVKHLGQYGATEGAYKNGKR